MWMRLFTALNVVTSVHGFASSPFPQSCASMLPQHERDGVLFQPQDDEPPFEIYYELGEEGDITVFLKSKTDVKFRGFMLEAREQGSADESPPVGRFILLEPDSSQLLSCADQPDSAVIQTNNHEKSVIRAKWTAHGRTASIAFRATFLQSFRKFWAPVDKKVIIPPPTPSTTGSTATTGPSTTGSTATTEPTTTGSTATTEPSTTGSTATTEPSTTGSTATTEPTTTEPSTTGSTATTEPSTTGSTATTEPTTTEPSTTGSTATTEPSTTGSTATTGPTTTEPSTTGSTATTGPSTTGSTATIEPSTTGPSTTGSTATTEPSGTVRTTTEPTASASSPVTGSSEDVMAAAMATMTLDSLGVVLSMELGNIFSTVACLSHRLHKGLKITGVVLCAAVEVAALILCCVGDFNKVVLVPLVAVTIVINILELIIESLPLGPGHKLKSAADVAVKVCSVIHQVFTIAVLFVGVWETDNCTKNENESWLVTVVAVYTAWIFLFLVWVFILNQTKQWRKVNTEKPSRGKKKFCSAANVISVIFIVGTTAFNVAIVYGIFGCKPGA